MPNALRIGLLGPLQVQDAAGRVLAIGGRQLRVLLTLLALNAGRVVPAGSLAAQLWPDDPPANPGNALQTLVSRLRAELRHAGLGAVIESHPAGYRLAVPPDAVDVTAFETLAAQGCRALAAGDTQAAALVLRDALHLWRGQALADAAGYAFADVAEARLTELRFSALADRIEADLALGEGSSLVGELRALLAADPLAERPRGLLMRALCATGRPAEALTVYGQGRELLADRLGVHPSARLEQVYLRILRGEEGPTQAERPVLAPPGPAARGSRVPSPLTSFVGRDGELSAVLTNLRAARLITLTGPGGVGKTRLATEMSGRLDVAAWFVPLAPVTDPAEVAYAVLDEVMILDNCEHVIEAAATLAAHVLAACPRLKIVVTSRQPLRIDGEILCPVPALPVPPAEPPFLDYGAVRLLRDRAVAVRPDFELDEANAAAAARICRTLDGMPLAIELAAVWLRTLTPAQLAERLDDRFALLVGGSRTALPRHRTLRAVVDWSWDLLSAPEQVLARRLAMRELIGGQDNTHAALRWAIAARDADTGLRFVRALSWYWMLRGNPGEPDVLAREVLTLEPRERSPRLAEARAVCAITAAGDTWDMDLVRPALTAALADFAAWSPDAALTHPIAAMGEPMLALLDRDLDRAFAVFDRHATSPDPWLRAAVPLMRGQFGSMTGRMEWAESLCQESLAAFRVLDELWGTAVVLVQLAEFAEMRADYGTAVAAIDEAASLARELGAWGDLAHISGKLAAIRVRTGDLSQARADLLRAEREEAERGAGQSDSAGWLGLIRAYLLWQEGDSGAAALQCAKTLAWLDRKPSSWWHGLRALIQAKLAMIVLSDGDQDRCRELLADALRVATGWVENPAIAAVIDAIAAFAQCRSQPMLAATLLGCGHSIRGCFNEGSLDAPAVRASGRALLGEAEFEAAYQRGLGLTRDDTLALAAGTVTSQVLAS